MIAISSATDNLASPSPTVIAVRLLAHGRVQGVGFRPAVARFASELGLAGEVCNTTQGVEIWLQGAAPAIERFEHELASRLPVQASIDRIEHWQIPLRGVSSFRIRHGSAAGSVAATIPRDLRVCPECLRDVADPANRRGDYPLASCTQCGPRYSILQALPYEREATSMAGFTLCPSCEAEYRQPADRRFHAQTSACQECGPRCWYADADGTCLARDAAAIAATIQALRAGQIVALKGLGGYQLLVDATNETAVERLRVRKHRPGKPLAVLVDSLATAESLAKLNDAERATLDDPAGPIVVVPTRQNNALAAGVARGLDAVGLMLPTTPLHWLIARECPPLVATSGNVEGEPLVADDRTAQERLEGIADWFLHHNRPICQPIDDSVVRVIAGHPVTLRLGRGLGPLPLDLGPLADTSSDLPLLAVGGHQKNAVAWFNGVQAALGSHVGDLDDLPTRERLERDIAALGRLLGVEAAAIAHDLHPDYFTSRWAASRGQPLFAVQHHHAHVVAGMIEHRWLDRQVLGVAWDGTGYGLDGTIWGGEFLLATTSRYRRVARFRPFLLPGGEAAIRQPWRIALALLRDALGPDEAIRFLRDCGYREQDLARLLPVLARPHLSPLTSSAGRLFDGVAAMVLPLALSRGGQSLFEGQAAMLLEASGSPNGSGPSPAIYSQPYPLAIVSGEPAELDWRPLVAAIAADVQMGICASVITRRFHATLAHGILAVAEQHSDLPVVLGGGVFQNRLLVEQLAGLFVDRQQPVGLPGVIPPNDGGLAAGQLAVAMAQRTAKRQ